jgi:arylsulfatase A
MGVPPHDTLLFDLKTDPGERHKLAHSHPGKVSEMMALMEAFRKSKGDSPPNLMEGKEADKDFYRILSEKHGPDYYKVK